MAAEFKERAAETSVRFKVDRRTGSQIQTHALARSHRRCKSAGTSIKKNFWKSAGGKSKAAELSDLDRQLKLTTKYAKDGKKGVPVSLGTLGWVHVRPYHSRLGESRA